MVIKNFITLKSEVEALLKTIIKNPYLHGLWLNTLSYLENCGARKIASCEHPTAVKEKMLKHAAEEFRHAFYLKKQLVRIPQHFEDYRRSFLLGSWAGYHYLKALDLYTCRYLKTLELDSLTIKHYAYLLVTYAIELRAAELYPLYHALLREQRSKIHVQSILLEEKEHLQEMEEALNQIPEAFTLIKHVCQLEADLFQKWLFSCNTEVRHFLNPNSLCFTNKLS